MLGNLGPINKGSITTAAETFFSAFTTPPVSLSKPTTRKGKAFKKPRKMGQPVELHQSQGTV